MDDNLKKENDRAYRIGFMTGNFHNDISFIYETLVDREYEESVTRVKALMVELRYIIKLTQEDDF